MKGFIVCGSFSDPKRAREYARFSSKETYATREEAQRLADLWEEEGRYTFVWIEG